MSSIGVAASKINTVAEVAADPLIKDKLLRAKDAKSGFELTLAPPPVTTAFLEASGRKLTFPPRFGEHNEKILVQELGIPADQIAILKSEGVI